MPKTGAADLFELVKSLTPQEKRYFKASYSSIGEHLPIHVRLFDILNRQPAYNEIKSRQILKVTNLRYANVKRYLYESIMESIRSYHRSKGYKSMVREMFDDYDILYNKNLYSLAEKVLLRAIELTHKYDLHTMTIEGYKNVFQLKMKMNDIKWIKKSIQELFLNIENASRKSDNHVFYLKNEAEIILFLSKYGDVIRSKEAENQLRKIKNNFLGLRSESQALSLDTRMRYNFQKGVVSYLEKKSRKSVFYLKRAKEIIEMDEDRIKQGFKGYLSLISNIFVVGIGHLSYSELKSTLVNIGNFRKFWVPENYELITSYYCNLLYFYISYNKYKEAIPLLSEIMSWCEKNKNIKPEKNMLYVYYYLSVCHFFNDSFENSLYWMNKVINGHQGDQSLHINSTLKIVNAIIHFEMKSDFDFLSSLVRSIERYFDKKKTAFKTESIFIKFFNKRLNSINSKSDLFFEFKNLQTEIVNVLKSPNEKWAQKEFDYLYWIENKIKRLEGLKRN